MLLRHLFASSHAAIILLLPSPPPPTPSSSLSFRSATRAPLLPRSLVARLAIPGSHVRVRGRRCLCWRLAASDEHSLTKRTAKCASPSCASPSLPLPSAAVVTTSLPGTSLTLARRRSSRCSNACLRQIAIADRDGSASRGPREQECRRERRMGSRCASHEDDIFRLSGSRVRSLAPSFREAERDCSRAFCCLLC